MIKYHIVNWMSNQVKEMSVFQDLTEGEHERLYNEIKNATLQGLDDKLKEMFFSEIKVDNEVNSLLLWVLGLTNKKPNGYQKIKSEGSYADVDLDFPNNKREDIFVYLKEIYGIERAAHIATFGTMAAKGSIRNAARALGYSQELQNKVAKFIPELSGVAIQDSIDSNKDFQDLINKDKEVKHIIDVAKKLEGLPNSIGMHASGFVLSDLSLTDYVPLMVATKKDSAKIMTQFEYKDVESNGILKWDILCIKTLDIIQETVSLIKTYKNIDIDIDSINLEDKNLFNLINDGFLHFIFQLDGSMGAYISKWHPDNIYEISDLSATARPGPLEMGLIDKYIDAKFNGIKYNYGLKDKKLINKLHEICKNSYGLLLFQEQLIKCFIELADFDEIEGDLARRAAGKKKADELKALGEKFIPRAITKGYNKDDIEKLFEQFQSFSSYSFNLSHSLSYSVISLQTAYLSYYFPLEFFTAILTICSDNTDDVRKAIKAVKERGFEIKSPNINKSENNFIINNQSIIFGFGAIKGVGATVSKKIIKNRPKSGYKSLGHFIHKNKDIVNSKVLESYAKAGVFSDFGNKESILQSIRDMLDYNSIVKDIKTYTIFDLCKIDYAEFIDNCILKKINVEDKLSYEIDALGLYIKKHPMEEYILDRDNCIDIKDIRNCSDGNKIITVGALSGIEVKKTKAKLNMASCNLDTIEHSVSCLIFTKAYSKFMDLLEEGKVVAVCGYIKVEESGITLAINDITDDLTGFAYKVFKKKENITKEFILNDRVKFILGIKK